jgi:hypothetical protein
MAISASDYLNISPSKFAATGAFDPVLNVDSLLFLDLLLRNTKSRSSRSPMQTLKHGLKQSANCSISQVKQAIHTGGKLNECSCFLK